MLLQPADAATVAPGGGIYNTYGAFDGVSAPYG